MRIRNRPMCYGNPVGCQASNRVWLGMKLKGSVVVRARRVGNEQGVPGIVVTICDGKLSLVAEHVRNVFRTQVLNRPDVLQSLKPGFVPTESGRLRVLTPFPRFGSDTKEGFPGAIGCKMTGRKLLVNGGPAHHMMTGARLCKSRSTGCGKLELGKLR